MMNKREIALVRDLEDMVRMLDALHPKYLTRGICHDIPAPTESGVVTKGWVYSMYNEVVIPACSSNISHGVNSHTDLRSQCAIPLYSTKKLALQAMRAELEGVYARKLAKIDEDIEKE